MAKNIRPELKQFSNRLYKAGLLAIVRRAHEIYREDVTRVTEEPVFVSEGFNEEGDEEGFAEFPGPHSAPGEYPHKETGQGEANIDFGVSREDGELKARFGVRGEDTGFGPFGQHKVPGGQHLVHLSHGRDRSGRLFGRLGMDRTIPDNVEEIRQAFIEAVRDAS